MLWELKKLPNVIVIIPAYNEEKTIDSVINNIKSNKDVDILVVNDGSSDRTSLIAKNNGVTVIDLPWDRWMYADRV